MGGRFRKQENRRKQMTLVLNVVNGWKSLTVAKIDKIVFLCA